MAVVVSISNTKLVTTVTKSNFSVYVGMGITELKRLTSQVLHIQELLTRGNWSVQNPVTKQYSCTATAEYSPGVKQVVAEVVHIEFVIILF